MIIREQYKTFIDKYVGKQEQQLLAVYLNPLRQLLETEQQRVIRLQQSLQTEVTRAQTAEEIEL